MSEAWVEGAQQTWPSLFASPSSTADRLVGARGRAAGRAAADELGDGVGAHLGRGRRRTLEEAVHLGHVGRRREARPHADRPRRSRPSRARSARPPRRPRAWPRSRPRPRCGRPSTTRTRKPGVLARDALVDLAVREPREPAPLVHEQDLDVVGARHRQRPVGDPAELVGPEHAGGLAHPRTPTCTLRKRAGDAPWPDASDLPGLALAAVRRAPHDPVLGAADRVARAPELRRDAGVVGVLVEGGELAALDAPGLLAPELEVDALVVDRPRRVRRHVDAVVGVADDLGEGALARLDRDVRHADQRQVAPPVGAARGVGGLAHHARGLAARQEVLERAVDDDRHALGRHALVVVAERAEPAGQRGVGGDRDEVARVAHRAAVAGGEPRRAGVGLLHAEHAIELDRVTDRLVDLQLHLPGIEHQGRDLARALGRREQGDGLGADALGFLDQAQGADVLVAGGLHVAAEGVRVAAPLHVAVGDRDRLDAPAGVRDDLLDRGAVARGEPRGAPEEVEPRLGEGQTGHLLHAAGWPPSAGRPSPRGAR